MDLNQDDDKDEDNDNKDDDNDNHKVNNNVKKINNDYGDNLSSSFPSYLNVMFSVMIVFVYPYFWIFFHFFPSFSSLLVVLCRNSFPSHD